jgi:hypothetical protein
VTLTATGTPDTEGREDTNAHKRRLGHGLHLYLLSGRAELAGDIYSADGGRHELDLKVAGAIVDQPWRDFKAYHRQRTLLIKRHIGIVDPTSIEEVAGTPAGPEIDVFIDETISPFTKNIPSEEVADVQGTGRA